MRSEELEKMKDLYDEYVELSEQLTADEDNKAVLLAVQNSTPEDLKYAIARVVEHFIHHDCTKLPIVCLLDRLAHDLQIETKHGAVKTILERRQKRPTTEVISTAQAA